MTVRMPVKKEDRVVITLKVDAGSYDELVAKGHQVKRGDLLGFSPHFDNQFVLSQLTESFRISGMTGKSRHCSSTFA